MRQKLRNIREEIFTSVGPAIKTSGKIVMYLILFTLAAASFEYVLLPDTEGPTILWRHLVLVGWAVAAAILVAIRSLRRGASSGRPITDGLIAAAITYAAIVLASEVLVDMYRQLEMLRGSIFWQSLMLLELAILFEGTRRLIDTSTIGRQAIKWAPR